MKLSQRNWNFKKTPIPNAVRDLSSDINATLNPDSTTQANQIGVGSVWGGAEEME